MESGRENVGQEEKVVLPLIPRLSRQFQAIEVGVRDQDEFGLSALIRSHSCVSVRSVRFFGIHSETGFSMAAMTIETEAAGNIERQHDTIACFDTLNRVSHFVDYAHDFVTDDRSRIQRSAAVVHVQIAAAYSAGCDPENGIGGALDFWFSVGRNRHLTRTPGS